MKHFMKHLWIAALFLITAVNVTAAESIDPVGTYSYTGTDPDGTAYQGVVTVEKQNEHFSVHYKEEGASGEYNGIGLVSNNVFSIAAVAEGKNSISILTPQSKGVFTGVWAWSGQKGLGNETWNPKK